MLNPTSCEFMICKIIYWELQTLNPLAEKVNLSSGLLSIDKRFVYLFGKYVSTIVDKYLMIIISCG